MIPLGLKETKQLDWATPLKVGTGLELRGLGVSQASRSSLLIEPSETLRPGRKKGLTRSCQAPQAAGVQIQWALHPGKGVSYRVPVSL